MRTSRAVVVGGGLAGLSAAVQLADQGVEVVLLEGRARLGGATHSFQRNGLSVDNGQHVLLRCYDEYLAFLRAIGSDHLVALQDRFDVPVITPDGDRARLYRRRGLPAPLHLMSCLANYPLLSVVDRGKVVSAALLMRLLSPEDDALDERSFGQWLRDHGQNDKSVMALWDLLIVAALNTRCENASLQLATKVFKTALLTKAPAADIGVPQVPLSDLHALPASRTLKRLGAKILLRTKATAILPQRTGLAVDTETGLVEADVVVLATPHQQAADLLPTGAVPQRVRDLGSAPIVNAHFVFDRVVTDLPFSAAVDSVIQWTFDRTSVAGLRGGGQYLAVSLSAAEDLIDLPTAHIRERLLPELAQLFPETTEAELCDFFVTRERQATFRQAPGCRAHRPSADTTVSGLFLAGAWTDTGWPDTMEGAVRSGNRAARLALDHIGLPRLTTVANG